MRKWLMFVVLYYAFIGGWAIIPHGNPLCLLDMSTGIQLTAMVWVPGVISTLWAACAVGGIGGMAIVEALLEAICSAMN